MSIVSYFSKLSSFLGMQGFPFTTILLASFPVILATVTLILYKSSGANFEVNASQSEYARRRQNLVLIAILVATVLGFYLRYFVFGANVTEVTPDSFHILQYGSLTTSYKDAFYNLIDVWATLDATTALVFANPSAHSLLVETPQYLAVLFGNLLMIYVISKRVFKKLGIGSEFTLLMLLVFTSPETELTSLIGLSILLTFVSLYALLRYIETRNRSDLILLLASYMAALLTHGNASVLVFFCLVWFVLTFLNRRETKFARMTLVRVTFILLSMNVFRYLFQGVLSGALLGYLGDIITFFFTQGSSRRSVLYSAPVVPRIVGISYSFLPVLALAPVILGVLRIRARKRSDPTLPMPLYAIVFTGMILAVVGFVSSSFSNSLSREFGNPAFALLAIPSAITVRKVVAGHRRYLKALFVSLIVSGIMAGLVAPSNFPTASEYQALTVNSRSAFGQYLTVSNDFASHWNGNIRIAIVSADNFPLAYSYLVRHPQVTPDGLGQVFKTETYSTEAVAGSSIVFDAGFVSLVTER